MASPLSLFLFITFTLFEGFTFSSSSPSPPVVYLPLTHSLSRNTHNTTQSHHLLKASSLNSAARHRRHRQVSLPLAAGSDYILSLSLGHRPSPTVQFYMDTGSDLVWLPCAPFECILCEGKPDASPDLRPPNISSAAFVPCNAPACAAAHSLPTSHLCVIAGCPLVTIETSDCSPRRCPPLYYAYADGSLVAHLRSDRLSFPASPPSAALHVPNFTFGCAHTALGEPVGVAGFGRGALSLPDQLAAVSPSLGRRFSYCLVSHAFDSERLLRPSPLILGRSAAEFVYTPILDNPKHPYFYSIGLEALSVAGERIPAPARLRAVDAAGNGGMVVDSGTTFTMLPLQFFKVLMREFELRMRNYERAPEVEQEMGMGLCYFQRDKEEKVEIPKLALHFVGNASMMLPEKNYFFGFTREDRRGLKRKVACLMMMNGGDEEEDASGPAATLGNYQQQGFEVVYDLEERKVGFAKRRCTDLWDSLAGGA